jgi:hypothetical protein
MVRIAGSSGPSPPLLVEPVAALASAVSGEDPARVEPAERAERCSAPPGRAAFPGAAAAVACASAAAADPSGPCAASARLTDGAIAPRLPPEPRPPEPEPPEPRPPEPEPPEPEPPEPRPPEPEPPEPRPPEPPDVPTPPDPPDRCELPPPGLIVLVGRPPVAVGTLSTYWATPEFPGGEIAWLCASAGTDAPSARISVKSTRLITKCLRLGRLGADSRARKASRFIRTGAVPRSARGSPAGERCVCPPASVRRTLRSVAPPVTADPLRGCSELDRAQAARHAQARPSPPARSVGPQPLQSCHVARDHLARRDHRDLDRR